MNMKLDMRQVDWSRVMRGAEWGVLGLALVCTLVLGVRGVQQLGGAEVGGEELRAGEVAEAGDREREGAQSQRVRAVRERNLFAPIPPSGFQGRLVGVLGDRALFEGNESAGVGERAHGAEVLEVGANWVRIEFEGEQQRLSVFDGGGGRQGRSAGRGGRPGRAMGRGGDRRSGEGDRPRMRRGGGEGGPSRFRGPGGGGRQFELTPERLERFRQIPPEMRERILERLPEDRRRELEEAL